MRFQVPQFIDVEDKIFGPLTIKQFIYLAGGASVGVVCVMLFGIFFGLLLSSPIVILAVALAFYKVNNRPFIHTLEYAFKYFTSDKLYIWKREEKKEQDGSTGPQTQGKYTSMIVPNISNSKLKSMNWEIDVKKNTEEA